MSKWLKPGVPIDRGPWAGCLRVRWRPARGAPHIVGYLPGDQPELKAAYDVYESRCWAAFKVPDAPEVHFADRLVAYLGQRSEQAGAVREEVERNTTAEMTLREWVGWIDDDKEEHRGPFWECTRPKGGMNADYYWMVLGRLGPLADRPMATLKSTDFVEWFNERMACAACVERAVQTGKRPGIDVSWRQLVPRFDVAPFDRVDRCEDHRTTHRRTTYNGTRAKLRTMFAAALGASAIERYGQPLVAYNPVPTEADLLNPRNVVFSASEGEQLRYGLSEAQVQLQTEASPPLYRAIPFVLAFTLNRAGQEFAGMNIGDFSWIVTDIGKAGYIDLRNFYRRQKGGGRTMSSFGKTDKTVRGCPMPPEPSQLLEDHIIEFRSTPNPAACTACRDGIRHWGGPLRSDHDRNPHTECDFAADAPIWVNEKGDRLDPDWYVKKVWHPMNERAGLTKEALGWKPQLKHSRSTGTTLHLDHGTPTAEVVRLGGWESEKMIADHYERHSRENRAKHVAAWGSASSGDGLEFENRRLRHEVVRLRALCAAGGIDPDQPIEPIVVHHRPPATARVRKPRPTKFGGAVDAVIEVAYAGGSPRKVLDALGVAATKKNYERLAGICAEAGIPKVASTGTQLPDGRKPEQIVEWQQTVMAWHGGREQHGPGARTAAS